MFRLMKRTVLASAIALSGFFVATPDADAGNPYCGPSYDAYYGHGHGHRHGHGYAPIVVNPYSVGRVAVGTPYIGPDRYGHGFGYGNHGYHGYRSHRAPIGVGRYPYGYSNFGGYNSYRGGSGFSLYIGQ